MPCTIYGEYLPEELLLWQQGKVSLTDPINNWNGPRPISTENAVDAINIYSSQDLVTLPFAIKYLQDPKYKIKIVPCISDWDERSFYIADHAIDGKTYRKMLKVEVKK